MTDGHHSLRMFPLARAIPTSIDTSAGSASVEVMQPPTVYRPPRSQLSFREPEYAPHPLSRGSVDIELWFLKGRSCQSVGSELTVVLSGHVTFEAPLDLLRSLPLLGPSLGLCLRRWVVADASHERVLVGVDADDDVDDQ